jgi:hypothetical protein
LRHAAILFLLGLAAGCTTTGGGQGVATMRAQPRPGVALPPAQGETALDIRAVGPGGEARAGVYCNLVSALFTAGIRTPAQVLLPDYGPNAPEVTVACEGGSAPVLSRPILAWSGGLGGWPSVGMSVNSEGGVGVGLGWWGGAVGTGTPMTRYPEVSVVVD